MFQIGDVVILKSGGKKMVVECFMGEREGRKIPECVWHCKQGKVHRSTYEPEVLKKWVMEALNG